MLLAIDLDQQSGFPRSWPRMRHLLWGCPYLPSLEFEAAACPLCGGLICRLATHPFNR